MGPMILSWRRPGGLARPLALASSGVIPLIGLLALIGHGMVPQRMLPTALAGASSVDAPPLQHGEAYGSARQRLLTRGWRRQPQTRPNTCSALQGDRRCALFNELVACSSTGPGFCRFQWDSPQGRGWAVITQGGNPQGDPGLISTWFEIP